jgi:uncharacterized RDD family membrane protein YckC
MQMTTDARAWLDGTVRRILARHPLGDAERVGITYELMSHLHAAGEARAAAGGRGEVTLEDLQAAFAEAGGEDGLVAAFIQPLSKPVQRVLLGRRLGAFAIDAVLLGIVLTFVHGMLVFLLQPFLGGAGPASHDAEMSGWWQLMPWGYHDTHLPVALQVVVAWASAVVVLGYFTWFEAHEGRTPGKRALELRVMRVDGRPVTYRESFIRSLAKLAVPLLLLDTLVMLLAFPEDRQRGSDKIAETVVVRA